MEVAIVTGGNGWLGKSLVNHLLQGHPDFSSKKYDKVFVLDLPTHDTKLESGAEFIACDVRDRDAVSNAFKNSKVTDVFHIAGIIHPRRMKDFVDINVTGTKNILEAATKSSARRAVVMSSNSPLGCNPHYDHRFDEESPYNPYMGYGRSKMLMEKCATEFRSQLPVTIVRAPWFYGPRQPARQTTFFQMIKNGKMPLLGGGRSLRSMSYIDNLTQGLIICATHPKANNETFWIADENPYSMKEIVTTVREVLEKDFKLACKQRQINLPYLVGDIAQLADASLQSVGLYHQKIHVLSEMNKNIACTVQKAKLNLGYRPVISLQEGMRRSIQWCLSNGQSI